MTIISDTLAAWRERREREQDLARVTIDEMTGYGLSPQEFRDIALMPSEQIRRMETMAAVNGLDPARLDDDRALQIAVALTCAHCTDQGRCRKALRDAAPAREATDFCPNSETYRMLAAE